MWWKQKALVFGAVLLAGVLCLQAGQQTATTEDSTYDEGTQAMNEGRWEAAEKAFQRTAAMKGKRADGAIYWQAYVEAKQGQVARASRTCVQLSAAFPQSRWRSECDALSAERSARIYADEGSGNGQSESKRGDDELKILALNSLMQQDSQRAIPILKNILQSNSQSVHVKERALFVLTQSGSKEAGDLLDQVVRGKSNPDLQARAIRLVAAMKGKSAAPMLVEAYRSARHQDIKSAAADGLFISGDAADLVAIARAESDPEMKRHLVSKLALMRSKEATDYMMEILSK